MVPFLLRFAFQCPLYTTFVLGCTFVLGLHHLIGFVYILYFSRLCTIQDYIFWVEFPFQNSYDYLLLHDSLFMLEFFSIAFSLPSLS